MIGVVIGIICMSMEATEVLASNLRIGSLVNGVFGMSILASLDFRRKIRKTVRTLGDSFYTLALVAFGPADVQYLETLALGPVGMRVGVAKTAPR